MEQQANDEWQNIAEVYNYDEACFITGLLNSAGISAKMERETLGNIYGLTVGPLAKILIFVPSREARDAEQILAEQNGTHLNPEEES